MKQVSKFCKKLNVNFYFHTGHEHYSPGWNSCKVFFFLYRVLHYVPYLVTCDMKNKLFLHLVDYYMYALYYHTCTFIQMCYNALWSSWCHSWFLLSWTYTCSCRGFCLSPAACFVCPFPLMIGSGGGVLKSSCWQRFRLDCPGTLSFFYFYQSV